MARFVLAKAIDLKIGTHVALSDPYPGTKWRLDPIHGFDTRGPKVKNRKFAISLLLLVGIPQDFYCEDSWQGYIKMMHGFQI